MISIFIKKIFLHNPTYFCTSTFIKKIIEFEIRECPIPSEKVAVYCEFCADGEICLFFFKYDITAYV